MDCSVRNLLKSSLKLNLFTVSYRHIKKITRNSLIFAVTELDQVKIQSTAPIESTVPGKMMQVLEGSRSLGYYM